MSTNPKTRSDAPALIPEELGAIISQQVPIPTIGIGAGRQTDGQVLVVNDVLGITGRSFRHNRRYQEFGRLLRETAAQFKADVEDGEFPGAENALHMAADELETVKRRFG